MSDKVVEILQKDAIKSKLLLFLDFVNPYIERPADHTAKLSRLLYDRFAKWLIDILLNGLFIAFLVWGWHRRLNIPLAIAYYGVGIYVASNLLSRLKEGVKDVFTSYARSFRGHR